MFFQPICMCIYVYILVMHIPHAHYLYTVLYALFIELHKFSKPKKNPIRRKTALNVSLLGYTQVLIYRPQP